MPFLPPHVPTFESLFRDLHSTRPPSFFRFRRKANINSLFSYIPENSPPLILFFRQMPEEKDMVVKRHGSRRCDLGSIPSAGANN